MSLVNTYTYEEGTDGQAFAVGSNGVVASAGSPVYSAAAALHGSMGASFPATATAVYNVGAASGQSSGYYKLHVDSSAVNTLWGLKTASTFHARVRMNPANGKFEITDNSNSVIATSTSGYTLDQWVRLDIRHAYVGTTLTLTVRLFLGANVEGTTPDETLSPTAYTLASTPTREGFGPPGTSGVMYIDTFRLYDDVTTWPAPYGTSSTPASGTGSISLVGSASGAAPVSATGAIALTGNTTAAATSSGTAAIVLTGNGTATGPGTTASGTISLTGTTAATAVATATGSIALTGTTTARGVATASGTITLTGSTAGAAAVTPQLFVDFEDGTTGAFGTVQGATVGTAYAHDGTKGVRLAPDGSGFATLTYTLPGAQQVHPWAAFRGWFRIVTKTNPANAFVDLIEIGNTQAANQGQFTVYTKNGDLGIDFNTSDFTVIDPAYSTGIWHLLEARVFFGDTTFTAYVRYDGVEYTHVSSNSQIVASVQKLWMQYPNHVIDQTVDWDSVALWYGDSDPGYLAGPNTGAGSINLTGTANATAPKSATGDISLTGASTTAAPKTASGAISFTGTAAGIARTTSSATLTLTGNVTARAPATTTASITLTGTANASARSSVYIYNGTTWIIAGIYYYTGASWASQVAEFL